MKFQHLFCLAITTTFLAGCVSPPWITPPGTGYEVVNSRSYQKSYDHVWDNIVGYLAANQMQLKSVAKESGVIYAEGVAFENDVADCGKDSTMQITGREAKVNIFVNRAGKEPVVTVSSEFKESRRMMTAFDTVTCNSKGVFEERILSAAAG